MRLRPKIKMKTILLHMRLILKTSPGLHLLIEYNYIMTIWMLYVKEEEVAYKLLLTGQMNYGICLYASRNDTKEIKISLALQQFLIKCI